MSTQEQVSEVAWRRMPRPKGADVWRARIGGIITDLRRDGSWIDVKVKKRRLWTLWYGEKSWTLERSEGNSVSITPPEGQEGQIWCAYGSAAGDSGRIILGPLYPVAWENTGAELIMRWEEGDEIFRVTSGWDVEDPKHGTELLVNVVTTYEMEEYLPLLAALPLILVPQAGFELTP